MVQPGESLAKDLTPDEFERFRDYIHQHSGIYLEEQKADSLRISLVTRATRFGFLTLDEYHKMLTTDESEFKELMNLVTINETSFFRFPAQFEALRTEVVPQIAELKPDSQKSFRVWSAGCSTGEEPYSAAMTLLDSGLDALGYSMEVLGTDVSTSALDRAKEGVYPARGLLGIPHSISTRFFQPTPTGHRVVDKVRRVVDFQYHNLIKEPYPLGLMGNWDVIFCRNVTIYFRLDSTRRVVENFYRSLNPGGYLFVGHSETLTSISDQFEPVEVGGVFLYRKPVSRRPSYAAVVSKRDLPKSRKKTMLQVAGETAAATRSSRRSAQADSQRGQRSESDSVFGKVDPIGEVDAVAEAPETKRTEMSAEELLAQAQEASVLGMPARVLEAALAVLELEPGNARAYLLAAWAHADVGDLDDAIEEANKALEIDPLLAGAHYILGMIHLRLDETQAAISEFKRTVYSDQEYVLAHLNLGNLYKAQGLVQDACRHYQNAVSALYANPEGDWQTFMGGFKPDLLARTCERSLIECRKASGNV